jgi:hypothetical protein
MATTVGSTSTVTLTTAFIDLSTFDEIECWLYGGKSVNRFRKIIRKSAWFTVLASQLNKCGTTGDFNSEMQAMFSRAGDYIRDVWIRAELPEVECKGGVDPVTGAPYHYQARWTRNIGHNLIDEAYLQFNDLTVTKLTSAHMDFITSFLTPASKWPGYQNMIGNVPCLTDPYEEYAEFEGAISSTSGVKLPAYALNIPLPFWFCRNHHDAILQAACPFNDVRLTIKFRAWQDLLIIDKIQDPVPETDPVLRANGFTYKVPATIAGASVNVKDALVSDNLRLSGVQIWAHYAVVPNGDREKISEEADIDVLIEQVQTIPPTSWAVQSSPQRGIDLRFAHSIRALFFAMRRTDVRSEWSNYSTHCTRGAEAAPGLIFRPVGATNPIARAVLTYENVDRSNMPSDYYTMVSPFYSAVSIPKDIGYHLLSYANKLEHLEPDGSTNFARLASVNLNLEASQTAILQSMPLEACGSNSTSHKTGKRWDPAYRTSAARFDILITASSLSVLRFSSGSAGFPVL